MNKFVSIYKHLTKSEKKYVLWLTLLLAFGTSLEALAIALVYPLMTLVSDGSQEGTGMFNSVVKYFIPDQIGSHKEAIIVGLSLLSFVYLVKSGYMLWLLWRQSQFCQKISARLSVDMFRRYLNLPFVEFSSLDTAIFTRNVITELNNYSKILSNILSFQTEALLIVGIVITLVFVNPVAFLGAAIGIVPVVFVFQKISSTLLKKWGHIRHQYDGERMKVVQSSFQGIRELFVYSIINRAIDQYKFVTEGSFQTTAKYQTISGAPRLWLELTAVLTLSVVILILISFGQDTTSQMPVLGLYAAAAFRLIPSVSRIISALHTVKYYGPTIALIDQELCFDTSDSHGKNIVDQSDETTPFEYKAKDRIELKGISYSYGENQVLKNVSLSIKPKSKIAIIGESGSGKSTLLNIILGLLQPTSGSILVGDRIVDTNSLQWRKYIGYVPQDVYLFDTSLSANISLELNCNEEQLQKVETAASRAQLSSFISLLPRGFESRVGERGAMVSGGQRQRLGIARSLYHNPTLLVLDEATSALDENTEKLIMNGVFNNLENVTVIIVTHRRNSIKDCDNIYELKYGCLTDVTSDVRNNSDTTSQGRV